MSTEATIVIKGRNDLGYAVKQAERDLKRLAQTGELVGKFLRGGAIVGAVVAFERLAENAQKAAEQIGDKGTARALGQLNQKIDELKAKGTNLIGKVLGSFSTMAFGSEYDKALESTQYQINELKKKLAGGTFGFVIWGPGGRAQAERDLAQYEQMLKRLQQNQPYGVRQSAPGGRNRQSTFDPAAAKSAAAKEIDPLPEFQFYASRLTSLTNDYADAIDQINQDALESSRDFMRVIGNETNDTLAQFTEDSKKAASQMSDGLTVYAEQAARNIQTAFADFLFDPFSEGVKGMLKGFIDTVRRMIAEAASAEILKAFFSWGASSFGGGVGKFFGSMASSIGTRATGGPVGSGKPYLVGERGPELFVPSGNGMIIPNGGGAGAVVVNYSIDARGADADRIMSILPVMLKQTEDRTIARVRELQTRGRM